MTKDEAQSVLVATGLYLTLVTSQGLRVPEAAIKFGMGILPQGENVEPLVQEAIDTLFGQNDEE